ARHRPKRWASAGAVLVIATWLVTSFAFRWYVSTFANFKTAVGQLTVFIVLMAYAYASSIVLLVGIELDELLREDASSRERGIHGADVVSMSAVVEGERITTYRTTVNIAFAIER